MRANAGRQLFALCLPAACIALFTSLPTVANAQRLDVFERKRMDTLTGVPLGAAEAGVLFKTKKR